MMNTILQFVGVALLLLASAAGVVGYFKANVSKSTIALYKEDNEALRTRLVTLEEQARHDASEIKALKSAQSFLTGVVTQAEAIAKNSATLAALALRVEDIAKAVGA